MVLETHLKCELQSRIILKKNNIFLLLKRAKKGYLISLRNLVINFFHNLVHK